MAHRKKVLAVAALAAAMSLAVTAYAGDASSSIGMGVDNPYATAELHVGTKSITAKTIKIGPEAEGTVTVSARGFAYNDQNPGEIVTLSSGTVSNPNAASVVLSKTGYSIYATATSYHTFTYKGRTVDKSLSAKP